LISRDRSKKDRRIIYISATQKGRDLEAEVMPRVLDTYKQIREPFSQDEWSQLIGSLKKISVTDK